MKLKYKVLFILVAASLQIFVSILISDSLQYRGFEYVSDGGWGDGWQMEKLGPKRMEFYYLKIFIPWFTFLSVLPISTYLFIRKIDQKRLKENNEASENS